MAVIRFYSPDYQKIEPDIVALNNQITAMANDRAAERFGQSHLKNPSEIELTPVIYDGLLVIVRTWHETTADNDKRGIIQPDDFSFRPVTIGKNMFIRTEDGHDYRLTPRQAILLLQLGDLAMVNRLTTTTQTTMTASNENSYNENVATPNFNFKEEDNLEKVPDQTSPIQIIETADRETTHLRNALKEHWISVYHFTPEEAEAVATWGDDWANEFRSIIRELTTAELCVDEIASLKEETKQLSLLKKQPGIPKYAPKLASTVHWKAKLSAEYAAEERFASLIDLDLANLLQAEINSESSDGTGQ